MDSERTERLILAVLASEQSQEAKTTQILALLEAWRHYASLNYNYN
jgi:hypothetical protein